MIIFDINNYIGDPTTQSVLNWLYNQDTLGPILSVLFTVLIIYRLLPYIEKNEKNAREKLDHFYSVAYAFIKIRENFSAKVSDGIIHGKNNCGYFHDFNIANPIETIYVDRNNNIVSKSKTTNNRTGLIFDEIKFFDYFADNIQYVDENLQNTFIEYFKLRFPGNAQKGIQCNDKNLIKLRKSIETQIIDHYLKYKKIINKN